MSTIPRYSKRQWLLFSMTCLSNCITALSFSLQSPFYPFEAESKGVTPTQYALVFSVYSLVVFLVTPFYGWLIPKVGAKLTTVLGLFTLSVTCSLFGLIDKINDSEMFIIFSFIIRIFEGTGSASVEAGSACIVMSEFPEDFGFAFSVIQTFFGLGLIIGPYIGGLLYETGGFTLPFVVIGGILLCGSILVCIVVPEIEEKKKISKKNRFLPLLKDFRVILAILAVFGFDLIIGTTLPLLEPHLNSKFNLSPVYIGYLYLLQGVANSTSGIFWGKLCDIWVSTHYIWCIGSAVVIPALTILGPTPYMPFELSIPLAFTAVFLIGLGSGALQNSAIYCFNKQAIKYGYPKDLNTYGFISALYCSVYSLATFIGSACAGFLYDTIGLPWTLQLLVIYHITLIVSTILHARLTSAADENNTEC